MSGLKQAGTVEFVSRDQILKREWGLGKCCFPCSADREQDWQPCQVDQYSLLKVLDVLTIHNKHRPWGWCWDDCLHRSELRYTHEAYSIISIGFGWPSRWPPNQVSSQTSHPSQISALPCLALWIKQDEASLLGRKRKIALRPISRCMYPDSMMHLVRGHISSRPQKPPQLARL